MLHYHHCLIQILNELLLGEGFLIDFQPVSIDKHGLIKILVEEALLKERGSNSMENVGN